MIRDLFKSCEMIHMNQIEEFDGRVYAIAESNLGLDRRVIISHVKKTINQNRWNTFITYTRTRERG